MRNGIRIRIPKAAGHAAAELAEGSVHEVEVFFERVDASLELARGSLWEAGLPLQAEPTSEPGSDHVLVC